MIRSLKCAWYRRRLRNSRRKVVCAAMDALGELADKSAVKPIQHLLEGEDRYIRKSGIRALIQLGIPHKTLCQKYYEAHIWDFNKCAICGYVKLWTTPQRYFAESPDDYFISKLREILESMDKAETETAPSVEKTYTCSDCIKFILEAKGKYCLTDTIGSTKYCLCLSHTRDGRDAYGHNMTITRVATDGYLIKKDSWYSDRH